MNFLTVSFAMLFTAYWTTTLEQTVSKADLERNLDLDNRIFEDDLLFESPVHSKIHCSVLCRNCLGCLTFTFTAPSGRCRGHSVFMTSQSRHLPAPGTETWTVGTWLYNRCESDSDCSIANSACFGGKCLCKLGFYFSLSQRACFQECAETDLHLSFVEYPGVNISTINPDAIPTVGEYPHMCQEECSRISHCRALLYWHSDRMMCRIKVDIPDDASTASWVTDTPYSTFYFRTCA